MYQLSETTKQNLADSVGIPYEKLTEMDVDKITTHIEKKLGKKLGYSQPDARFSGSGDDSVYIDQGLLMTMATVDRKLGSHMKKSRFIAKIQNMLKGQTSPHHDPERSR